MAHTVRTDMDEKAHSKSTVFSGLNPAKCKHLKRLSVYSRMVPCDPIVSQHPPRTFSHPFNNFEITITNNRVKKRKFDNSSPDDGYESPAKRFFTPEALSPDLGCFMDYCSPHARQDSVSPFAPSKPALLDKAHAIKREIKESLSFQLRSEHVGCGSSTEPGGNEETGAHSLKCEKVVLNLAPAFDCDVDDILCLSPVGTYSVGGFSKSVESRKSPSSNIFHNKPVVIPTVAHGQELEGRGELKKKTYQNVKEEEADKGYFSASFVKEFKIGKNTPQSDPRLPTATSSPLQGIGVVEGPQDECHPESPSDQAVSGKHISFSLSDLCPAVSAPRLQPVNWHVDSLDGDVEELLNIGPPLLESSRCPCITVKLSVSSGESRQLTEEVQGGAITPLQECQATLNGEESSLDTSYESSHVQVQVKSVAVVPSKHTTTTSTTTSKYVSSGRSQRPAIFNREVDWEREKQLYVRSVARHIKEGPGGQDVMTELLNLMTDVDDQTPGTSGRQWQHPSDLTRRNYQRRFGNMRPKMTLQEWQAKNGTTYKRFANVPKIFERSQFS